MGPQAWLVRAIHPNPTSEGITLPVVRSALEETTAVSVRISDLNRITLPRHFTNTKRSISSPEIMQWML